MKVIVAECDRDYSRVPQGGDESRRVDLFIPCCAALQKSEEEVLICNDNFSGVFEDGKLSK